MDNLLEAGEFSIDLYTMPDSLTTKLWEFFVSTDLPSHTLPVSVTRSAVADYRWLLDQEGTGHLGL